MLNQIVIMGRMVRDPELRYTQSQVPVVSFTLAVDRDYQPKDGGEKQTDFIDCTAWRGTAEFISKYFQKGSAAAVAGRMESSKWQDNDGNNRTSWGVTVDHIYFAGSKNAAATTDPDQNHDKLDTLITRFGELVDVDDGELPY